MRQEQGFCQPSIHRQSVKEVLPLILYLFVYLLLWTTLCGAIPSIHKTDFKLQWLVYSIIVYILRLFVPFICLLYLSIICCRKECNKEHPLNTTTSFVASNEFTDQEDEPLIIKQGTKVPHPKSIKVCLKETIIIHSET